MAAIFWCYSKRRETDKSLPYWLATGKTMDGDKSAGTWGHVSSGEMKTICQIRYDFKLKHGSILSIRAVTSEEHI